MKSNTGPLKKRAIAAGDQAEKSESFENLNIEIFQRSQELATSGISGADADGLMVAPDSFNQ